MTNPTSNLSQQRPERIPPGRDHRIDALRGLALLMMLVDHVPDNLLNRLTLRNFNFADAAEIFVLLAGYASYLAYGRLIDRQGWRVGITRVLNRCLRLYLYQIGMTLLFVWIVRHWRHYRVVPEHILEPQLAYGYDWLWRVLTFNALPGYLNILPLYILLIALFPALYAVLRRAPFLVFGISLTVWTLANLNPSLTIPNWLDPQGWYLNPFGWQLLYLLGIISAIWAERHGGNIPVGRTIRLVCGAYLILAFILSFPYEYYGLGEWRPFPAIRGGKATLAPWRLLSVMALFALVQSSHILRRLSGQKVGQVLAMFGRNSLEIFSLSAILDLLGRLIFSGFGNTFTVQVAVNTLLIGGTIALAIPLDHHRQKARTARRAGYPKQTPAAG